MATTGKPPSSWDDWRDVKDNSAPAPVELWLEFPAAVEEPLPSGVDMRESEIYAVTGDNLTGYKTLDHSTKQLVKDYNAIALHRRDIIRRMYRIGKTESKGLPKAIADDVRRLCLPSSEVKNSYRDLKRKGGRPVRFPIIFDESIKAPKM
ncbi:hypothetical protein PVAP13_8NG254000 [Panicum virgatum]|uniref:Uncharacterized protein n=1 Tax=Panicum virgatum TaxID=38727 RepID=A0A8T0P9J9_PANVG|nr:hypothetical protein PVAP13_8NG254000 [Panicum virgatum]